MRILKKCEQEHTLAHARTDSRRDSSVNTNLSDFRLVTFTQFLYCFTGFIILLTSFTRLVSPLQCYDCVNATLSCDETTASCTHDCEHVAECPQGDPSSYGMACLAAKSPSSTVFLSCFPLQERIEYYCLVSLKQNIVFCTTYATCIG